VDKGKTILHTSLPKYDTRPYLPHLMLSAFHNDKEIKKNNAMTFMTDCGKHEILNTAYS
jgi:hypothetical protein